MYLNQNFMHINELICIFNQRKFNNFQKNVAPLYNVLSRCLRCQIKALAKIQGMSLFLLTQQVQGVYHIKFCNFFRTKFCKSDQIDMCTSQIYVIVGSCPWKQSKDHMCQISSLQEVYFWSNIFSKVHIWRKNGTHKKRI